MYTEILPHPAFKHPPLNFIKEFKFFEQELPVLLVRALQ